MPEFPKAEEIVDDIDIGRLIAEFSGNAEAIAIVIDVERIIKDAPLLEIYYVPLCKKKVQ